MSEGICCVCGHKLSNHIDEGNGWRCHSLGHDAFQCECYLRKDRDTFSDDKGLDYYDLKKRIKESLKELKKRLNE